MKNFLLRGINSNMLKTIAVIAMVIDHIGFYFMPELPKTLYFICRSIGRIAMPIFVYTLVQGFYHTKNFKKYILRLSICAVITQIIITILMIINKVYFPQYTNARYVYTRGNILFAFVICLLAMKILHEKILIKKWDYNKNLSLKLTLLVILFVICMFVPIDYGIEAFVLSILMYFIEKFKIMFLIQKSNKNTLKGMAFNLISDKNVKLIYLGLILMSIFVVKIYYTNNWTIILAIIPIALYNDEKGKCNNFVKYAYYITFGLQHALLYALAMFT